MTLSDDQTSTWRSVIYFVDYKETSRSVTCNNFPEKLWMFWQMRESSDTS